MFFTLIRFDEEFKNNPEVLSEKTKYLHYLEYARLGNEPAESWDDISAPGLNVYTSYPGDQIINWKERGYSTVLDILMVLILSNIHFTASLFKISIFKKYM